MPHLTARERAHVDVLKDERDHHGRLARQSGAGEGERGWNRAKVAALDWALGWIAQGGRPR
jgi:hypothetical protein